MSGEQALDSIATRRERRWHAFVRFLRGDDVFLSYARADAGDYARALAVRLIDERLSCFLDQWGTPPGSDLPDALKLALRRSTLLVVIASPAGVRSGAVAREVETFAETGRAIIPIDVDGSLSAAPWYSSVVGMALTLESLDNLAAGTPSPKAIQRIVNADGFVSRARRLRRAFWQTVAGTIGVLAVGAAVGWWLVSQANQAADRAKTEQAAADRAAIDARRDAGRAQAETKSALDEGVKARADASAARLDARTQEQAAARQRTLARALSLASRSQLIQRSRGPEFLDGMSIALEALADAASIGAQPGEVDAALRSGLALLPRVTSDVRLDQGLAAATVSANGQYLATARGRAIEVSTIGDQRPVAAVASNGRLVGVSGDGRHVLVWQDDGLSIVEVATGRVAKRRPVDRRRPPGGSISPDLRYLLTRDELWDLDRGTPVGELPRPVGLMIVNTTAYGLSGRVFARAGLAVRQGKQFGLAQIWRPPAGAAARSELTAAHLEQYEILPVDAMDVQLMALDAAGAGIATVTQNRVIVWRLTARGEYREVGQWPASDVEAVAFVDGTSRVVLLSGTAGAAAGAATGRHRLVVLEPEGHREAARVSHTSSIGAVAFDGEGRLEVDAVDGRRVWKLSPGEPSAARGGSVLASHGVSLVPDVAPRRLTGASVRWPSSRDAAALATSPNGRFHASADRSGRITVRAADHPDRVMRVIDYRGAIEELLFSERGAYLAGTDHGGPERTGSASVNVWEVATGRVRTLRGAGATSSVAFSPREHYVAVGTLDGAVHIGELTGGRWRSLRVGGILTALAFSRDERLLATGDGDFARVWDVATGEGLAELAHEQAVYRLVFSPDNRYLASVSEADGTDFGMDEDSFVVRVFLLRPEDLRAEACSRLATLEPALGGWVAAMRAPQRLCTGVPQLRAVIPGAAPP